jgi:hypothetical protein
MINIDQVKEFVQTKISTISAETFGWLAAVVLHASTVPSLLAVMAGLTDRLPGVDLVLLVWTGLTLLFVKAAIQKDMLNIVTIGVGFYCSSSNDGIDLLQIIWLSIRLTLSNRDAILCIRW